VDQATAGDRPRHGLCGTVEEFAARRSGARVGDIARRAGTTDPTFYRYFLGLPPSRAFRHSDITVSAQFAAEPLQAGYGRAESTIRAHCYIADPFGGKRPLAPVARRIEGLSIVVAESRNPFCCPIRRLIRSMSGFSHA